MRVGRRVRRFQKFNTVDINGSLSDVIIKKRFNFYVFLNLTKLMKIQS